MDSFFRELIVTLLALIFAGIVVLYSLKLVSAQALSARSLIVEALDRTIDELILYGQCTVRNLLLLGTRLLRYKWAFARQSSLAWTDFVVSSVAISTAIPGWRDILFWVLRVLAKQAGIPEPT